MEKKYYWLKLKKDFFQQREIKKLRTIAGGDTLTIIYLKMQLLSLQDNASILYAETEETISEQIALELDEKIENVQLLLGFLNKNRLIEYVQNQDINLLETKELIGSETAVASRVRKHRANKKTLPSNSTVTKCNIEIEIEKELEKEKEEIKVSNKHARKITYNTEALNGFYDSLKKGDEE